MMSRKYPWTLTALLFLLTSFGLAACQQPQPLTKTSEPEVMEVSTTPVPATVTKEPTPSVQVENLTDALEKAKDAAEADNNQEALAYLKAALDLAENESEKGLIQELIEDAEAGDLDEVAEDIEIYLSKRTGGIDDSEAEKAQQLYIQMGCFSCHGANYEGNTGPIIAGVPADDIKAAVRSGFPEAEDPMPAFSPEQLSDEDLDLLANFLSRLTLEDIGLDIPEEVAKHLQLAWEALEARDKAGVGQHLEAALEALPPDSPEGLRVTLEDLLEDLGEEEEWVEGLEHHLKFLVQSSDQ